MQADEANKLLEVNWAYGNYFFGQRGYAPVLGYKRIVRHKIGWREVNPGGVDLLKKGQIDISLTTKSAKPIIDYPVSFFLFV